MSFVRILI